jgi:hypothetical protein|tara:strand:- start:1118 stop:3988 length:2871 start_codon:yes stop_codon:yes gene_type:complete
LLSLSTTLLSQEYKSFYLELASGIGVDLLDGSQIVIQPDQTIKLVTNQTHPIFDFLNSKPFYSIEKAFPMTSLPRLKKVYIISIKDDTLVTDFVNNTGITYFKEIDDDNNILTSTTTAVNNTQISIPNDYEDLLYGGNNASLELINAPLAWAITTGDSNILVGVVDSSYELNHPDLTGQIVNNIEVVPSNFSHGTAVASIIAANTDNNEGLSSLGRDLKLVTATCGGGGNNLVSGLEELADYPGVRVINCSWRICEGSPVKTYLDDVMDYVRTKDILVVASAGNGVQGDGTVKGCDSDGNGYGYPGSYDDAISVTGVGHRFSIGTLQDNIPGQTKSWIDVHRQLPDNPNNFASHTHNDKVNVSAPGIYVLSATETSNNQTGYTAGIGTSSSTPLASALAGLIFSINPNFTATQVKDIIESTTDNIYDIDLNQPYIGELGTGRINAYAAVLKAQCLTNPESGLDLAMQNSQLDNFEEPDTLTTQPYRSKDIWVRNQDDGLLVKEHQNPEYDSNNPNYVYVRVTNSSCDSSTGSDPLKLYWAKANTALSWPDHWDGSLTMTDPITGEDILMGDQIGTVNIPPLDIGQEAILTFEWLVPNPEDYENINPNPWHFCLLARIDTPNDPMTTPENDNIVLNVWNNNNIVWKNTTVVDVVENSSNYGGVVAVGNYSNQQQSFDLVFVKDANEKGKAIYEEAEVGLEMDTTLYNAWQDGGKSQSQLKSTKDDYKKILTTNNSKLGNIILDAGEIGTLYVSFNFFTNQSTSKDKFALSVLQQDATTGSLIGGEEYIINKKTSSSFRANAGEDQDIKKDEFIVLSATPINEDVTFNWYDQNNTLLYSGENVLVNPEFTSTYKLEVISNLNGFKDYDHVDITVNPFYLESLIPNPANNLVTVQYKVDEASSAYLSVVNTATGQHHNYILDTTQTSRLLDISNLSSGIYSIILVCDGEIQDSLNLSKL